MSYEFEGFAPQGWECPICKRVYSPTTPMCYYCGGETKTATITSTNTSNESEAMKRLKDSYTTYVKTESTT